MSEGGVRGPPRTAGRRVPEPSGHHAGLLRVASFRKLARGPALLRLLPGVGRTVRPHSAALRGRPGLAQGDTGAVVNSSPAETGGEVCGAVPGGGGSWQNASPLAIPGWSTLRCVLQGSSETPAGSGRCSSQLPARKGAWDRLSRLPGVIPRGRGLKRATCPRNRPD